VTGDARFADGGERPLRLRALDAEDLAVISSLVQDAVFPVGQIRWLRRQRRFAVLLNRFRWEDGGRHGAERVQSVLVVEDVQAVRTQGFGKTDPDLVLSILSLSWVAGEDGTGEVLFTLAGDGAVSVAVEALEVVLKDVTRPYRAPSGKVPSHPV
jgi:hypothetical protein